MQRWRGSSHGRRARAPVAAAGVASGHQPWQWGSSRGAQPSVVAAGAGSRPPRGMSSGRWPRVRREGMDGSDECVGDIG